MSKIDKLIENGIKSLMIENLEEKAVSKNQQQFMGMVHAYKKGEMKDAPASVKKAAKGMTKKAAKDFASTKHKGLPTRVDESVIGDILIIADENNTYEKFTAELIKQKYIMPDELEDPETEKELRAMYDGVKDGSSVNEALAPTNDLKRVSESTKENKMNTKTESIVKRLKEDTEYQKFFRSTMDKFGVKSPKELSDKKKKEFFNYVDKNYKAKSEGKITEAYFGAHGGDSAELKKAKAALANWFNNISAVPRNQLDILHDLIDDYAYEYAQDWASGNMM